MMLLVLLLSLPATTINLMVSTKCPAPSPCRCGHKNDTSMYIYCSKQNWNTVPLFSKDTQHVFYDELILSSNNIQELNADSFNRHGRIRVLKLDLSHNPIKNINIKSFNPLARYLRELRLSSEHRSAEFPCRSLERLRNLSSLEISSFRLNQKCSFPKQLKTLLLYKCLFNKELPNLTNLIHLEELTIEYSDLRQIKLPEFPQLKKLSLSGNGLKTLAHFKLSPAPLLQTLDLSINQLTEVFPLLEHLHSLQTLILKHNELSAGSVRSLFQNHCCLHNLTKLNLDRNLIEGGLDTLNLPPNLRELYIRGNRVEWIGVQPHFLPPLLHTLDLAGNPMTRTTSIRDPYSLSIFPYLKHLDLSGIKTLASGELDILFDHLQNSLNTLLLANMSLTSLPLNTRLLFELRSIDISNNVIASEHYNLPEKLEILSANNVSLSSISAIPTYLRRLEVLSLNSNQIRETINPELYPNLNVLLVDQYYMCNDCSSLKLYRWLKNHRKSSVLCQQQNRPSSLLYDDMELADTSTDHFKECKEEPSSTITYDIPIITTNISTNFTAIKLHANYRKGQYIVSWNRSSPMSEKEEGMRVTLRRLPFGPLISSPNISLNTVSYEFRDNSNISEVLAFQVCLIVRRRDIKNKHCKNFNVNSTTGLLTSSSFTRVLSIALSLCISIAVLASLVLLIRWFVSEMRLIRSTSSPSFRSMVGYGGGTGTHRFCCQSGNLRRPTTAGSHLYHEIVGRPSFCCSIKNTPFDSLTRSSAVTNDHACHCHLSRQPIRDREEL